jgi:plastocyanin
MHQYFHKLEAKIMTFAKLLFKHLPGVIAVGLVVGALAVAFVAFSPHSSYAASASASPATTVKVSITTNKKGVFTFKPESVTIAVGTTVKWTNTTTVAHTVTSDDGVTFSSGIINPGSTFKFTFKKKGTFGYHCSIHPFMTATIIVK